jgi:protein associated with RNAse G/E
VRVEARYYTGALNKRWLAYLLESAPEHIALVRAHGSPLWSPRGQYWTPPGPAIEIYPRGAWFNVFALLDCAGALQSFYCNIALPPTFDGATLRFVDLDLDLGADAARTTVVYDKDEFAAHAALWHYPPEVCRQARGAVAHLQGRLAGGDPLFEAWRRYLPGVPPAYLHGVEGALTPACDAD